VAGADPPGEGEMIVLVSTVGSGRTGRTTRPSVRSPTRRDSDELRVAAVQYDQAARRWRVDVLPQIRAKVEAGDPPTRELFRRILKDVRKGRLGGDWVLFVHGFNQSFLESLNQCRTIEALYGVNVLAFSWPSNQGGFISNEYKKARAAARGCTNTFDRMLEKLGAYLAERAFYRDCKIHISLMAYSLGNYVVENYVRAPVFCDETKIFNNVILTQPDVDVDPHTEWVEMLDHCKQVYVTIHEDDSVLKWSDLTNPDRLGNTVKNLRGQGVVYFDFTDGRWVGSTHGVFYKTARKNKVVYEIFRRALTGRRAERTPAIVYNERHNTYELRDKDYSADVPLYE
jgi:hypothetical protein